jgi:hypothetical protein
MSSLNKGTRMGGGGRRSVLYLPLRVMIDLEDPLIYFSIKVSQRDVIYLG